MPVREAPALSYPQEHTSSYYAATRRITSDFPQLDGDRRCDVAVVGGGFTGVSAALHLVERGYRVVLLEANRVAWGASGRNGGQLIDGFVRIEKIRRRFGAEAAAMVRRMAWECRDIVVERIGRYAIDCDLEFGFLDVAERDAELRGLEADYEDRLAHGYPHELRLVPADGMAALIDSKHYIGGLVNMGNGHLHPLNLCAGEARAAAGLGAEIFEQTPAVRVRHGSSPAVETATGTVRAAKVILAGNAYLGKVEPKLYGRVIPAGSYMLATEPLGEARAAALLPSGFACCEQAIGLNYFRLAADTRLLFGGICNYSGRSPRDIAAALRPRLVEIFPQLAGVGFDYQWGGDIAISVNRIPQFGRIGANTYFAQGYSGHGVAPTHLAGKMLADVVAGDSEQFDLLARVRHWRLPGGKWFANPALALGMLYFRLKELL